MTPPGNVSGGNGLFPRRFLAVAVLAALACPGAWGAAAAPDGILVLRGYERPPRPERAESLRLTLREGWQEENPGPIEKQDTAPQRRRFLLFTMANAYPGLESEELIEQFFNAPMRFIAPGFEDVTTFGDMRDWNLIWTPNAGMGYILSPKWSVFVTLGYGEGPVRTKGDYRTRLLVLLHTDFEMKRSAFTITPGVDYFPLGMVEQRDYAGWKERLCSIKPVIGLRTPWTYAAYEARVKVGFKYLGNLVNVKLEDSWRVWSVNMNLGLDIPINRRHQFNMNLGYSYFFEQHSDFGGPVFSMSWKYHF